MTFQPTEVTQVVIDAIRVSGGQLALEKNRCSKPLPPHRQRTFAVVEHSARGQFVCTMPDTSYKKHYFGVMWVVGVLDAIPCMMAKNHNLFDIYALDFNEAIEKFNKEEAPYAKIVHTFSV